MEAAVDNRSFLALIVALLLPAASPATIWYIEPDSSGSAPTIQEGINRAAHHDTVLLAPGTYYESISFIGKKITVASWFLTTGDAGYIDSTVIDAGSTYDSVVMFNQSEEPSAMIFGLTLANGHGTLWGYNWGGGVFIRLASPTLRHLVIRDCMYAGYDEFGGGIAVLGGAPLIDHVRVEYNAAHEGGGIQCEGPDAHPTIRNTVIVGNEARYGSGISLYGGATAFLENVVMADNVEVPSGSGCGATCNSGSRVDLVNVTIAGNDGGGVEVGFGSTAILVNSIVWENDGPGIWMWNVGTPSLAVVAWSDIEGGEAGIDTSENGHVEWLEGNIDGDPRFQTIGGVSYTLSPESPCVDAGTDFFEYGGEVLVDLGSAGYCGDAPDMGGRELCVVPTAVEEEAPRPPTRLAGARPNPFNARTAIGFSLGDPGPVEIGVYDIRGRLVAILAKRPFDRGVHSIQWDGTGANGDPFPSGIYLVRMKAATHRESKKIMLLR